MNALIESFSFDDIDLGGDDDKGIGDEEIEDVFTEAIFQGELFSDSLYFYDVEDDRTSNYCFLFDNKSMIC